ncbi:MAG: hypothetical protein QW716_00970 [Desulfurococcaceae archaeon]
MSIVRIAKFFSKTFIKNPYLWFWSIFFVLFWLIMGAFIFSRGITKENISKQIEMEYPEFKYLPENERVSIIEDVWKRVALSYTGSWLATCIIISFASTVSGVTQGIFYSVLPLRFLTRYSKVNEVTVLLGYIFGLIIVLVFQFIVLLFATIGMYSYRFGLRITPENPLGLLIVTLAISIFKFLFSLILGLTVVILRKPRALTMLSFVPLILSYALSMAQIYVGGKAINLSPINSSISLLYYYFTNIEPPLNEPLTASLTNVEKVKPIFAWSILLSWIALLSLISLVLMRKQKGISAEELSAI